MSVCVPVFADDVSESVETAPVETAETAVPDTSLADVAPVAEQVSAPVAEQAVETTEEADKSGGVDAPTTDIEESEEDKIKSRPEHVYKIAAYSEHKTIHADLKTTAGVVSCDLFAGTHPLTVLNFVALAKGKPAWTDGSGTSHSDPYYRDLKFAGRSKNAYVISGLREEGVDFVIADERCTSHKPVAGAIAMVQPHPGMASTQFILLARDMPVLKGMYTVFGTCGPIDVIKSLTKADAVLEEIVIKGE